MARLLGLAPTRGLAHPLTRGLPLTLALALTFVLAHLLGLAHFLGLALTLAHGLAHPLILGLARPLTLEPGTLRPIGAARRYQCLAGAINAWPADTQKAGGRSVMLGPRL